MLEKLKLAAKNTVDIVNKLPQWKGRANEFGNYVELKFAEECLKIGLDYGSPKTTDGKTMETGYPDGFVDGDYPCYVEVKTFLSSSEKSTFRSFFFSPSKSPKITKDASHLLVGFATTKNSKLVGFHFTDMFEKNVVLKMEFNQNNKEIYKESELL